MNHFKGKSILLAVPNHFGLPDVFKKNLEFLGFKVFLIEHNNSKIKISKQESFIHFCKKTFYKNKTHKTIITAKKKEAPQLSYLKNIKKTDFALVIRPDLFSSSVLQKIKEKSNWSVGYQWDGIYRFPLAKKTIPYFDRFFVFDQSDVSNHAKTEHISNFYFDYIESGSTIKHDVFFVGTFMKDRIKELVQLCRVFEKLQLKTSISLIYHSNRHIKKYKAAPIHFRKTGMSFEESIINAQTSNVILDFQNSFHNGLSFRAFEAIGYEKKLITNNPLVKNYDSYHPENIFILNPENIQEVGDFLSKKPVKVPLEIINKYSFTNWIQNILSK